MLQYERIDVSERIDINKSNKSESPGKNLIKSLWC